MKEIPLSKGMVALVDDCDYDRVAQYKWYASHSGRGLFYARRDVRTNGVKRRILMHRFIMDCPESSEVDHRDGNTLDNRRHNLRTCTDQQNKIAHRRPKRGTVSKYRGVHWLAGAWCAQIQVNKVRRHIGRFSLEDDAARAYDAVAKEMAGEFCQLNFP